MMEVVRLKRHRLLIFTLIICLLFPDSSFAFSFEDEVLNLLRFRDRVENDPFGALSSWNDDIGVPNPCSWFGVECANGHVVALNLRNMRLGGTLASELGNLSHIKSIILRNNSFYGMIPNKIKKLKKLKLLDLGYNKFGGAVISDIENSQSRKIILLDNNPRLDILLPQADIKSHRKLLQNIGVSPQTSVSSPIIPSPTPPSPSPSPLPTPSPSSTPSPSPAPSPSLQPVAVPTPSPAPAPPPTASTPPLLPRSPPAASGSPGSRKHILVILGVSIGGLVLVGLAAVILWRCNKVATVRPWATGLSGQLQKAFVTGVPKLKRSELEAACEDFSNVIGSTSFGTVYKGTLSSGVEIAVASVAAPSAKDWSKHLESLFRKRIDMLSKVNHKNFVNLLGFCEEDEPFTRMIAFEYAPNGTLFEHLHIQESEHLDWGMRMRIAMGMAYCLDHMHQLTPPITHQTLNSSSVNLTEDYAAKISDLGLCNDSSATPTDQTLENNVYSFAIILFEIVTGRIPYAGNNSVDDWVLNFLKTDKPLIDMVDPTLDSFDADQLEAIDNLIRSCVCSDQGRRPNMRDVSSRLKEVTRIGQEGAIPKISPLWWAELEILSTEAT